MSHRRLVQTFLRRGHAAALVVGLALLGAAHACDFGPKSGDVVFDLSTATSGLGAVRFTMRAVEPATIDTVVAACAGCRVFMARVADREVRGVLTGALAAGPALRATVSDREATESYMATIQEVARSNFQLDVVGSTTLSIPAR